MSRKLKDEGHMRTVSKFKEKRMDRAESERDSGFSDASSEHLSAVDQTETDDTSCSVGSAGAGSRSETGSGSWAVSGSETSSGLGAGSRSETGSGSGAGSRSETGSGSWAVSGSETSSGSWAGSRSETGSGSGAGSRSETGSGSGAGSRSQLAAAVVGGGALQGPMIIMNNVVLKQSGDKPWSFSPAVEVVQQPQVVFLQPMVPQGTHPVSKGFPSKRRRHKKYLPILKSYPKIAPHPVDAPQGGSSGSSVKSSSQSECSQEDHQPSECSSTPPLPHPAPQHDANANASGSSAPQHAANANASGSSTPQHAANANASGSSAPQHDANANASGSSAPQHDANANASGSSAPQSSSVDNKLQRFCNTYNILSRSGLLGIALRTKELMRQNRRTQTQLERLRRHTTLYTTAMQTGDCEIWSRLQTSIQEENRSRTQHREDTPMIH